MGVVRLAGSDPLGITHHEQRGEAPVADPGRVEILEAGSTEAVQHGGKLLLPAVPARQVTGCTLRSCSQCILRLSWLRTS